MCFLLPLFMFIVVASCTHRGDQGKYVKVRKSVLEHYQADSNPLKLKAATFLLDNLSDRYTITGERYVKYAKTIKKYGQNPDTLYARLLSDRNKYDKEEIVKDTDVLTPEYLIENIDRSFAAWEKAKWKDQISFENFCEYILPYRNGNESVENWRKEIEHDPFFETIRDTLLGSTNLKQDQFIIT